MADLKITEEEKIIFYFLNDLRDSGETNMFAATSHIEKEFGTSTRESLAHLRKWMKNFNQDGYEHIKIID